MRAARNIARCINSRNTGRFHLVGLDGFTGWHVLKRAAELLGNGTIEPIAGGYIQSFRRRHPAVSQFNLRQRSALAS
ncbi:hypothetical protein D9M69_622750 [compost metagenome]